MDGTVPPALDGSWVRGPLFQGLSEEELGTILDRATVHQFLAGDVLIQQDVWSGRLFIVHHGVVQVIVEKLHFPGEPIREVPVSRMSVGDVVGEGSLLTGTLPSATVRAVTDGQALVLTQEDFLHLVLALPTLSHRINTLLGERLRSSNMQMAERDTRQVVMAVGEAGLWHNVAGTLARLSGSSVLVVDLHEERRHELTLSDLMNGRVRTGPKDQPQQVISVQGNADERAKLASFLGRVGDEYHTVLVLIPEQHAPASRQLFALARRIVVAGPVSHTEDARRRVETVVAEAGGHEVGVVLTGATAAVPPTVSNLELFSERVGAPVRAILCVQPETMRVQIEALGRWLVGRRIGIAFGAGGAKGWAHVGVLRCLHRAGVPVDCITGVSIGSIIGAAAAMNRDVEWMERTLAKSISRIVWPAIPFHGVLTNRFLGNWLRKEVYGDTRIEDTPIPLAISAADLTAGGEVVLRHGAIWQAVLASSAIPGIYPAVRIGSHHLVDGGVVNPVPLSTARLLGADIVIAIDLSIPLAPQQELESLEPERVRPPFIFNNILRSRDIMMSVVQGQSVAEPSILVKPAVEGLALRNFSQGSRFITAGEEAMEEALPALRRHLPWLGALS